MAAEKQIPLDELLFGPKSERTATPAASLADVISHCYRKARAGSGDTNKVERLGHQAQEKSGGPGETSKD